MTTDTRLTDSQIYQAYREAESTEDYARRIEAIVRKDMRDWKKVITVPCSCHEDVEKARKDERERAADIADTETRSFAPPISMELREKQAWNMAARAIRGAILRGDGKSDDAS